MGPISVLLSYGIVSLIMFICVPVESLISNGQAVHRGRFQVIYISGAILWIETILSCLMQFMFPIKET